MLSKWLFVAGRVAPPLAEYAVSAQQQQQQQQQQQIAQVTAVPQPIFFGFFPSSTIPAGAAALMRATPMCLAPVPRAGDWTCQCGFSNFASRTACFGCQRPRAEVDTRQLTELKPGDWACACGTHNFSRRSFCMTCEAPRPSSTQGPGGRQSSAGAAPASMPLLPGDWHCASCLAHNFRARSVCIKCGANKSEASSAVSQRAAAETAAAAANVPWTCPACHTANPHSRKACEICGVSRPQPVTNASGSNSAAATTTTHIAPSASVTSAQSSYSVGRAHDWNCPQCSFFNFGSRTTCKQCASLRPEQAAAAAGGGGGASSNGGGGRPTVEHKKGDWTCSCGCHNFARRTKCFDCSAARPVDGSTAVNAQAAGSAPSAAGGASPSRSVTEIHSL